MNVHGLTIVEMTKSASLFKLLKSQFKLVMFQLRRTESVGPASVLASMDRWTGSIPILGFASSCFFALFLFDVVLDLLFDVLFDLVRNVALEGIPIIAV